MSIGVRELRDTLSRQLRAVRRGETVVITDHARPIAKIVTLEGGSNYSRLVAEGRKAPPGRARQPAPEPVVVGTSVLDLLDEQRG